MKSRDTERRALRGWMTDRIGHMERETAVGGEKQGQIKSERGRWRERLGVSELVKEREKSCCHPSLRLLIRY